MTTSTAAVRAAPSPTREPRPFLFLEPTGERGGPRRPAPIDVEHLEHRLSPAVAHLERIVTNHTIRREIARARRPQPIPISVLNRRRRAARSWLVAICAGQVDAATMHAVATQWLPILCGTGHERSRMAKPARELFEFVRGAATAVLFDRPAASLVSHARALHALESTLAAHLAAVLQVAFRAGEPAAR